MMDGEPPLGVDGTNDPGASLHMPHCLLIFTIYELVHFIYAMPSQGTGTSQGTAQLGGDGRQQVSHGSCPASLPSEERPMKFPYVTNVQMTEG